MKHSILSSAPLYCFGICIWLIYASHISHPGHADPAFYLGMARQIVNSGNMQLNYVWHFLSHYDEVRHYAFDYWLPGTSLVQASSLFAFGRFIENEIFAAMLPPLLCATAVVFLVKHCLDACSDNGNMRFLFPVLFIFLLFAYSQFPLESPAYAGSIYAAVILCLTVGLIKNSLRYILFAFGLGALGRYFRGDALLFLPYLLLCIGIFYQTSLKEKFTSLIFGGATYFVVLVPLYIFNLALGGFTLPSTKRLVFISQYNDLYSFNLPTRADFFANSSLLDLLSIRFDALISNIFNGQLFVIVMVVIIAFLSTIRLWKKDFSTTFLGLGMGFVVILITFYSFFLPYYGIAVIKSSIVIVLVMAWFALVILIRHFKIQRPLQVLGIILITIGYNFLAFGYNAWLENTSEDVLLQAERLCEELESLGNDPITVMYRQVWQTAYTCPTIQFVQVPTGGREEFDRVVEQYKVSHLVVENSWAEYHAPYLLSNFDKGRLTRLNMPTDKDSQLNAKIYKITD